LKKQVVDAGLGLRDELLADELLAGEPGR